MSRTVRKNASALLVEGSKDARVLRTVVDESVCDVVQTEGKRNATGALNIMRKSNHAGVLVVIDSDFSRLDGQLILDPDVLSTDDHDIEGMLLKSPAPEKVMIEYDLTPDYFGKDLGFALAKAVMPLGYMRLASSKHRLNLDFKNLEYGKFVVGPPPQIDDVKLSRDVIAKSPHCKHTYEELLAIIASFSDPSHDCWQVGCGHDMTAVLAVLLSNNFGREIPSYTVERQLRLSYHPSDFAKTNLYTQIEAWEQRNSPYSILRK